MPTSSAAVFAVLLRLVGARYGWRSIAFSAGHVVLDCDRMLAKPVKPLPVTMARMLSDAPVRYSSSTPGLVGPTVSMARVYQSVTKKAAPANV